MNHNMLIAPFQLGLNPDGSLQETSGRCFDLQAYSRMKYGVRTDVQYFAKELAAELRLKAPQLFTGVQPPALLTAYKAAAPPATTLARYCLDIMNLARFQAHVAPGELVQVYRPQDYIEEYAILPAEERKKLMGSHTSNSLRGRSLAGFTPVILDDISVTGTYTAMMRQVLQHYEEVMTAYVVVCDDTLKNTPDAEGRLNNAAIHCPSDLLPFIEQGNFVFTRRFLKLLLRTPTDELQAVVAQLPALLLEEIRRAIVDTDAALQHLFPETCALLLAAIPST